jgi:hypothetical protein
MAAQIVTFTPDLLPAVVRFSKQVWARPEDAAYFAWRYLDCPSQIGHLAMEDGECTAMIWAFRRPYQIGDRRVTCLDTFDWFALPSRRGALLGVRLVQALMNHPEPIVAVGGSQDTLGLLPRLQWRTVGEVTPYVLPLEGGEVGRYLERRLRVPASWGAGVFRATARPWFSAGAGAARPAPGAQALTAAAFDPTIPDLYADERGYSLLPVPDLDLMRWLFRGPDGLGALVLVRFAVDGDVRGWSLSRVSATGAGRDATIIDLFARGDDARWYDWMVAETVSALRAHAPDTIHATASAAPLQHALRRARFMSRRPIPVRYWPGAVELPPLPLHLGNNTSDTAIFSHPTARPA